VTNDLAAPVPSSGVSLVYPGSLLEWAVVDYRKNAQGVVLAHKAPNAAILSGQKTNLSLVLGASANLKPIAAAGPDRTVEGGQTVILDGSGSHDPDGSLKAYRWEQTSGTQVSLSNATKVKAQLVTPKVSAQASLTFRLTVTDSSGLTASDTVTVTVKPEQSQVVTVGETDTVVIAQTGKAQWHTVQLARSFANPVVLAQVVTKNGGHPVTVRIKDVTAKSFKLQLDEWEYLDQSHAQETVAYAVLERGRHVLADNTVIEVGTRKAFLQASAVSFEKAFGLQPVVVAQVQTANDARAVVTRLDKVSTSASRSSCRARRRTRRTTPKSSATSRSRPRRNPRSRSRVFPRSTMNGATSSSVSSTPARRCCSPRSRPSPGATPPACASRT